ncbi:hypothetical protein [Bacillus gaemokensis]|uniref:ABM domain-containing protein n=1 Tax=Bacillus gaemokensis TaxID=574375 RepID=A0A073KBK1_9BACI|nr:hypothetical protein [Bacillus gaemokensis]KEK24654.1 hypothetical protein BAGA_23575 [Bacillus gaemokensis]KYG34474.1 hypothetical protein AZF08_08720 [Bacillus gaemokensis]
MFVKVYQYHIQLGKEKEYLEIQEKAREIYQKYIFICSVYLKNNEDESKWIEMHWYENEEVYKESIRLIYGEEDIKNLWNQFESVIDPQKSEIVEWDYSQVKDNFSVG